MKTEIAKACIMAEPTGAYNSLASLHSVCCMGQICLSFGVLQWYMTLFPLIFVLTMITAERTPCELFHKRTNLSNLSRAFIFGSWLHVKICQSTHHHCVDPHSVLFEMVVGLQGALHIYQYLGDTGQVQYATHAVINELASIDSLMIKSTRSVYSQWNRLLLLSLNKFN